MRIAHVVSTFPPYHGGMGNVAKDLAERAATRGHEVVVVTPKRVKSGESRVESFGIISAKGGSASGGNYQLSTPRPWARFGNAAWCPGIRRALEQLQPDIVHLHWPFIGGIASVLRWRRGGEQNHSPIRTNRRMVGGGQTRRQLIVHYHMDLIADGWKGMVFRWYERWALPRILRFADRVVVSSLDYAEHGALAPHMERLGDRLVEISFGVDVERFTPHPPTPPLPEGRVEMKKYFPPSQGGITTNFSPSHREGEREGVGLHTLFVGGLDRAHAFKGVPVLLEAFARLAHTDDHGSGTDGHGFHGWRLRIIGDGDLRPFYEARARALGIADRVEFLGAVSDADLPAVYQSADIFVLPSTARSEAFGIVLLEAMASGIPVIASDLPGVRTVVADGQTGYLVPSGDATALAERLAVLGKNPEQVRTMGVAARRRVEERYTWDRVMDGWDRCYQTV